MLSLKIDQCTVSEGGLLQKCTLEVKESKMIEVMIFRTGSEQLELITKNGGGKEQVAKLFNDRVFFQVCINIIGLNCRF